GDDELGSPGHGGRPVGGAHRPVGREDAHVAVCPADDEGVAFVLERAHLRARDGVVRLAESLPPRRATGLPARACVAEPERVPARPVDGGQVMRPRITIDARSTISTSTNITSSSVETCCHWKSSIELKSRNPMPPAPNAESTSAERTFESMR